jgi:hypothetical protein
MTNSVIWRSNLQTGKGSVLVNKTRNHKGQKIRIENIKKLENGSKNYIVQAVGNKWSKSKRGKTFTVTEEQMEAQYIPE